MTESERGPPKQIVQKHRRKSSPIATVNACPIRTRFGVIFQTWRCLIANYQLIFAIAAFHF
jgi:hypothetical protein